MKTLKELQKEILENKKKHGFNTTDIYQEFCFLYGEDSDACDAYYKKKNSFPEELADIAIFLLGISEICNIDLYEEILKKVEINSKRKYKLNSAGVLVKIPEKK